MGRITVRTRDGRAFLEGWAVCVAVAAAVAYVLHGTVAGGAIHQLTDDVVRQHLSV